MQNIVVFVDLDDEGSSNKVLTTAIDYARHTGARLHVMAIVPNGMFKMTMVAQIIPADYERKLLEDARQRLAALIKKHATDDVQLEQVVSLGSVYEEALHFARNVDADLIVVGAHKPELTDYFLGPNAGQIVHHATCSVWVVRD